MTDIPTAVDAVLGLSYMTANALRDLREKQISVPLSAFYAFAGTLLHFLRKDCSLLQWIAGLLPGLFLCLLALWKKEAVGAGDGIVIVALGCAAGFEGAVSLFFYAALLAGVWCLARLLLHRCRMSDSFPFMPFLLLSYLLRLVVQLTGRAG